MAVFKTMAVGRVVRPETQVSQQGKEIKKFSLAVQISKNKTEWLECVFMGDRWDRVWPYIEQGKIVFVEGYPKTSAYIHNSSGEAVGKMSIYVDKLDFVPANKNNNEEEAQRDTGQQKPQENKKPKQEESFSDDDDLPF